MRINSWQQPTGQKKHPYTLDWRFIVAGKEWQSQVEQHQGFRWIQMDSDGFRWIQMDSDGFSECAIPKFLPVKIVKSATNRLSEIGPTVHRSTESFSVRKQVGPHSCPKPPKGNGWVPGRVPGFLWIPGNPGQGNINCKDRGHHSHGFPCGNSFLCHALGIFRQW